MDGYNWQIIVWMLANFRVFEKQIGYFLDLVLPALLSMQNIERSDLNWSDQKITILMILIWFQINLLESDLDLFYGWYDLKFSDHDFLSKVSLITDIFWNFQPLHSITHVSLNDEKIKLVHWYLLKVKMILLHSPLNNDLKISDQIIFWKHYLIWS